MTRGMLTPANLRARSRITPGDACWHWLGYLAADGTPRIHTLDYDAVEKKPMSGAKAVFYIAHRCALNGRLAYRACFVADCVNPDHIRTAATRIEIGRAVAELGVRKGTSVEQRRANVAKAHAANGIRVTPPEVVLAIRSAPAGVTGLSLAALHGIGRQTVSKIRRGLSHQGVA